MTGCRKETSPWVKRERKRCLWLTWTEQSTWLSSVAVATELHVSWESSADSMSCRVSLPDLRSR